MSGFVIAIIIFLVLLAASGYVWLVQDAKKHKHLGIGKTQRPPMRLESEIENLASMEIARSHEFFEEIDRLKKSSEPYPKLLKKVLRKERNAKIALLTLKHQSTLLRNLRTAVKRDDYGTVLSDDSSYEILRFLESMGYPYDSNESPVDYALVESALSEIRDADYQKGFDVDDIPGDGIDFEHWVSDQLKKFDWDTEVTQPGSDQGIDIIARYNNTKVGIQCKRYKANVGNKAVQEAFAAKRFFGLDRALVITTAGYTKSAQELAQQNGVGLYTVDDIPVLARLVEIT